MNPRPLAPQASALAGLRYAPTEIGIQPAPILPEQLRVSITKIGLMISLSSSSSSSNSSRKTNAEDEDEEEEEDELPYARFFAIACVAWP